MSEYTLAQHTDPEAERERLARIRAYQDPPTIRRLEALGVGAGWHCADVGAGAGSIAAWLGGRVGPGGRVLATDLDTGALRAATAAPVEVLRHDIRRAPLPGAYDLVHTRLLLIHLPERREVLQRMAAATRPGGWVVVGDIDLAQVRAATPAPALDRLLAVFDPVVRAAGWDPHLGSALPGMLEAAGLEAVEAECFQGYQRPPGPIPAILAMTLQRLRPLLLSSGRIDEAGFAAALRWLADPGNALYGPAIWTAWGRRPDE